MDDVCVMCKVWFKIPMYVDMASVLIVVHYHSAWSFHFLLFEAVDTFK